jgi:hypothetical protein
MGGAILISVGICCGALSSMRRSPSPPLLVAHPLNAHFLRLPVNFWILVVAPLIIRFVFLYRNGVCSGEWIVPDARYLPADSHSWIASGDLETVAGYFVCDIHRRKSTDASQLIPEIFVQGLKPVWKLYYRLRG